MDKNSPVAQANIDLAAFESGPSAPATNTTGAPCSCQGEGPKADTTFELNPKGYAVFHVSAGAGGYAVRVGKAAEDSKQQNQFDSGELKGEDIFSAVILRPGTYSASNSLAGKAKGKITVGYPKIGKTAYRPPSPAKVVCSDRGFEPANLELQPGQAVLFHATVPSRITLELLKADDGPADRPEHVRPGWRKAVLPEKKKKKA